jgi:O-antigen/teichoic acid export membrane protein
MTSPEPPTGGAPDSDRHAAAAVGRRVGRNLAWKVAGTVVDKALRLGLVIAATRAMGETTWGRLAYATATTALIAQLADLGTALFLARETARRGAVDDGLLGGLLGLRLVLALLYAGAVSVLALAHLDEPAIAGAIAMMGAFWLLQSTLEFGWHIFRGLERLDLEARQQVGQSVLQAVLGGAVVAALWLDRDATAAGDGALLAFAGAMLLSQLAVVLYAAGALLRARRVRLRLDPALLRRFRREVLPLGVAIVASLIYYKIDIPMLRAMRGDAETGHYAAAYRLLEMLAIVPAIALSALFPAITRQLEDDPALAMRLHRRARWALGGIGGCAALCFLVAAEPIVELLYGAEFAPSAAVLRALAPAIALTFVNYLETHMLVALGAVRWQMWVALALIGLNVGVNALWIPRFGAAGAALATGLTELCLLAAVAPYVGRALRRAAASHATRAEAR